MYKLIVTLIFSLSVFNAHAAAVLVDGDDTVIGVIATLVTESVATVVSEQGYAFNVDRLTGDVLPYSLGGPSATAFYLSSDCTGDPITVYTRGNTYIISANPVMMYAPNAPASPVNQAYNSLLTGLIICTPSAGTIETFDLLANDPMVTGVPAASVTRPVRVETRTNCIFSSGFESCPNP